MEEAIRSGSVNLDLFTQTQSELLALMRLNAWASFLGTRYNRGLFVVLTKLARWLCRQQVLQTLRRDSQPPSIQSEAARVPDSTPCARSERAHRRRRWTGGDGGSFLRATRAPLPARYVCVDVAISCRLLIVCLANPMQRRARSCRKAHRYRCSRRVRNCPLLPARGLPYSLPAPAMQSHPVHPFSPL
jgi:hypothetical protein